mmetsp:Transcript_7418/g.18853  ORF Transcript_7418/g.18853 Transcript_7418/m.18853 type:complete len:132 (+) Transcript_7418:430-825(+)
MFNPGVDEEGGEGSEGIQGGAAGEDGEERAAVPDGEAGACSKEHAGKRIDFVLQESTMEVGQAQSYISSIAAHCIYFESPDVVSFLRGLADGDAGDLRRAEKRGGGGGGDSSAASAVRRLSSRSEDGTVCV